MVRINPEAFFPPFRCKNKTKTQSFLSRKKHLEKRNSFVYENGLHEKDKTLSPASTIIVVKFRARSKIALKYNTKQKQKPTHVALRCFSHVVM